MTQDEIIRMARESGVYLTKIGYEFDTDDLCRFAALVAAHEREKQAEQEPELNLREAVYIVIEGHEIAAAIRSMK